MDNGIQVSMLIDLSDKYILDNCYRGGGRYTYYFGNDYVFGYNLDELRQNVINHFRDRGFDIEKFR